MIEKFDHNNYDMVEKALKSNKKKRITAGSLLMKTIDTIKQKPVEQPLNDLDNLLLIREQ